MICRNCNSSNKEGSKFCKECGSILGKAEKNRCPRGHVLDPTWGGRCAICESGGNRPAPSPDGDTRKGRTVQEDAGRGKSGRPIRKTKMESHTLREALPTSSDPNVPKSRKRKKTMVMSDQASEGADKDFSEERRLVGFLVTYSHKPAGEFFELRAGRYVVGSGNRADIHVPDKGMTSEHAILLFRRGKFLLRDNLSTNGTFVNGEDIVGDVELGNYDSIKMGNTDFRLIKTDA